jgi:hypothetical protein
MYHHYITEMVEALSPVLKNPRRAELILKKYWHDKMAIVWNSEDVHQAANQAGITLTDEEAAHVLQDLHEHHNVEYGLRWDDVVANVRQSGFGRRMTKQESKRSDLGILIVQRS